MFILILFNVNYIKTLAVTLEKGRIRRGGLYIKENKFIINQPLLIMISLI